MARGTPRISSGTLPIVGSGQRDIFYDKIISEITAYQSNGVQAWGVTTIATREKVLHSVGDRALGAGGNVGDTDSWLYLMRTGSTIMCSIALDYSPTSGAWANAYRRAYTTNYTLATPSDTAAIDWWMCVNEYEIFIQWVQSGARHCAYFGSLVRMYSTRINGLARITSQSGTGNGVILGTDRDISASIQVGQYVHLINQTPDGVAIQSVAPLLCVVKGVSSSTITCDGVSNTYAVGSLVGLDPASFWVFGDPAATPRGCMKFDCTWADNANSAAPTTLPFYVGMEGDNDPCLDSYYPMLEVVFLGSATPNIVPRGKTGFVRACPWGVQADGDLMQIEGDAAQIWKCWANVEYQFVGTYATCVGPGAT
jgi:hypothetical protein